MNKLRPSGGLMTLRAAKPDKKPGSPFWGCANYPDGKGISKV